MIKTKAVIFGLAGTLLATTASADSFKMWPYKDANWDPEFNLSVTAGQFDPRANNADTESVLGIQLGLNCPWFGPPVGDLRQQFNLNKVNGDGYDLTTFEINPRWYAVDGNLKYGAGPGFGYMWLKPDVGDDAASFTLQASVAVEYRINKISIGAGSRFQRSLDREMFGTQSGDNFITDIKLGFDF